MSGVAAPGLPTMERAALCIGGGESSSDSQKTYDAYATGDLDAWERKYGKLSKTQNKLKFNDDLSAEKTDQLKDRKKKLEPEVKKLGKKVDNDPAAEMDMREAERQGDITRGQKSINENFKQFDDAYYDGYKQDYVDFYNPQLDKQFGDATGKLTAALAGRGTLASTVGIGKYGDLQEEKDLASTTIANDAADAANSLRGSVEDSKANLYSLNESAADPKAANNLALGQATALVAPPTYDPLGQVFANFLAPFASGISGASGGTTGRSYSSIYPSSPSGSGSGKVYG
jgi:hypothetical protein